MNYIISVNNCRAFFNVPARVLSLLKISDPKYCKVLLYILGNDTDRFSSGEISRETDTAEDIVKDAITYWFNSNIITLNGSRADNCEVDYSTQNSVKNEQIEEVKEFVSEPLTRNEPIKSTNDVVVPQRTVVKYTPKELANLIDSTPDLVDLFEYVQTTLNRPITYTEQTVFINLHQYYHFQSAVIILLLEYCVGLGKTSPSYLETVAKSFFDRNIVSFQDVEKEIIRLDGQKSIENKIINIFGINSNLTPKQKEFISNWVDIGMDIEMITLGYEKCVDQINKLSFPYINRILQNWAEKGITTKELAEKEKLPDSNGYKPKEYKNSAPSYNLDEYERYTLDFIPKVKNE